MCIPCEGTICFMLVVSVVTSASLTVTVLPMQLRPCQAAFHYFQAWQQAPVHCHLSRCWRECPLWLCWASPILDLAMLESRHVHWSRCMHIFLTVTAHLACKRCVAYMCIPCKFTIC